MELNIEISRTGPKMYHVDYTWNQDAEAPESSISGPFRSVQRDIAKKVVADKYDRISTLYNNVPCEKVDWIQEITQQQ